MNLKVNERMDRRMDGFESEWLVSGWMDGWTDSDDQDDSDYVIKIRCKTIIALQLDKRKIVY